jgi:hypothetical protein
MGVSLKTERRRSQRTSLVRRCPVFSMRPRVRWAEGVPGMTTEDLHGNARRSAPPANGRRWSALLPLICVVIPDHSSFSVLRETPHDLCLWPFQKAKMLQKVKGSFGARREVRGLFSYYPLFPTKEYQFRLLCSAGQGHIQGLPHFNGKTRWTGFA